MIALELLAGWSLDELDEADVTRVEEHLFECSACAETATFLLRLRAAVPELARRGLLRFAATGSLQARMERDGLEVRTYDIRPGQTVACQADPAQHYAVTRMHADLRGVQRVEALVTDDAGQLLDRVPDVPFDPSSDVVALAEMGDVVRGYPTMRLRIRLLGHAADGTPRELGRYGLSHRAMGAPSE